LPVKAFCAAWLFLPGVWEFDNNYFLKCFLSRNISKYFCYQQVKTLWKHKKIILKMILKLKNKNLCLGFVYFFRALC
jgi:hypothetical protein